MLNIVGLFPPLAFHFMIHWLQIKEVPRRSPQPPPPAFRPLPPIRLVTSTVEISEVDDLAASTPGELLKATNFKLTAMLGRFKTLCIDAILRHSHLSILPFVNRKLCIWPMFGEQNIALHFEEELAVAVGLVLF